MIFNVYKQSKYYYKKGERTSIKWLKREKLHNTGVQMASMWGVGPRLRHPLVRPDQNLEPWSTPTQSDQVGFTACSEFGRGFC